MPRYRGISNTEKHGPTKMIAITVPKEFAELWSKRCRDRMVTQATYLMALVANDEADRTERKSVETSE